MNIEIMISHRESRPVVCTRFQCTAQAIPVHLREMLPPVYGYVEKHGATVAETPFLRYHTFVDGRYHLELGIPLEEPLKGKAMIEASELPGGPVAIAAHVGPYRKLGKTHGLVRNWIRDSDEWEANGPGWDFFLDDPRKTDAELGSGSRRTRVCYPVRKIT